MTYEELVEKARQTYGKADASGIEGHLAYQFNITGEAEGAFYLEINNGQVRIEPYEYYDRDVLFTMTAKTLIKLGTGALDPVLAYTTGKLKVQGSLDKALLLKKLTVPAEAVAETEGTACVETATEVETADASATSAEASGADAACAEEDAAEKACEETTVEEDATKACAETVAEASSQENTAEASAEDAAAAAAEETTPVKETAATEKNEGSKAKTGKWKGGKKKKR